MNLLSRLVPPFETMEHAWTGHYEAKGDVKDADCILGFSFGYRGKRKGISPGLSNQDLANVALKHYPKLPKILQYEIADAYADSGGETANITRISQHRVKGRYLDTREVAEQAKLVMEQNGYRTALLLAHPYHMPRVQAVCTQLGINWVTDSEERGAVEFDPQSTQGWTRDLDHWRGYEPMALMFYRLKGWL